LSLIVVEVVRNGVTPVHHLIAEPPATRL
jgi:hypothetical protein